MSARHIIAFDAGGTAVKAAVYDDQGRECAVAGKTMAPLRPANGHMERDPQAMWEAVCEIARRALDEAGVAPSSIAAVGLTGYGNGLYLLDRNGARSETASSRRICGRRRSSRAGARTAGKPALFRSPISVCGPASRRRCSHGSSSTNPNRSSEPRAR